MENDYSEQLDRRQAARFLALPDSLFKGLVRAGRIKEYSFGRRAYYKKSELELLKNTSENK